MKILLTRPWNRTSMLIPNHGLAYLASMLKKKGHQCQITDCIKDKIRQKEFSRIVSEGDFDLVGFQVYTFDLDILEAYLSSIERTRIIIAGGPHPSADPVGFLSRFTSVRYCFRGEAENSFPLLVDLLESNPNPNTDALRQIRGLYFRDGENISGTPPEFVTDLDSFGFPDWDQISPKSYPIAPQGTFTKAIPYAPIIITRGCPFPCTFCAGKLVSGKKIRSRSVDHVISELTYLKDRFGIKEFHIQDDNFTHYRDYVLEFCEKLIDSKLNLHWACPNGIRLDSLDVETIQAMNAAGCYSVAVGIEAGTQRILDLMKKHVDVNDMISKVKLIRQLTDWYITGFFILGYPSETIEEIKATIRLSLDLPIDKANYGILMPLPGTEAAEAAIEFGWNPDKDLSRMSEYRSPFTPSGISAFRFRWLFRYAFIRFYARPKIVMRILGQVHSMDQFKILAKRFWDVISP
ncbi:B12-binding domain-containing radical SAM protein [bacterium]|nr:B12-binding domain-containing radical SAM protein [candidate division CSSED10-310 bacterium]